MFEDIKKSNQGAAALVSSMVIASALFSVVLSVLVVSLNMKENVLLKMQVNEQRCMLLIYG